MKKEIDPGRPDYWMQVRRRQELPWAILGWVLIGLMVLALLGLIAFKIWVHVKYANCTIDEIPAWALWWMFGRG